MRLSWSLVLSSAATSAASYAGNLNYRSPSENHPGLGVSIHRVAKRGVPESSFDPSKLHFTHGVASGDPYPESVILWTRCSPSFDDVHSNSSTEGLVPLYNPVPIYSEDGNEKEEGHGNEKEEAISNAPVCLNYMVSEDESFKGKVSEGTVYTSSDIDYTVKVSKLAMDRNPRNSLIESSGRGSQVEALYHLLLSVPSLQLRQQEPDWKNQDDPRFEEGRRPDQPGRVLLLQLPYASASTCVCVCACVLVN